MSRPRQRPAAHGVIIVHSDIVCAEALERLVNETLPEAGCGICVTAQSMLQRLRGAPASLGIFGSAFPDCHGLDLIWMAIKDRLVDRVLAIGGASDEAAALLLRQLNVHGVFDSTKEGTIQLRDAITAVWHGKRYCTPGIIERALHQPDTVPVLHQPDAVPVLHQLKAVPVLYQPEAVSVLSILTRAELRIYSALVSGTSNKECARQFGISEATLKTHRQRIMRKLGVHTPLDLLKVAIETGVLYVTSQHQLRALALLTSRAAAVRSPLL